MTYYLLLALFLFLPLQFALNPAMGIDLASARIAILALFVLWMVKSLLRKNFKISFDIAALCLYSFLFICLFSLFFAQNIPWGLRKFAFLLSLFPIFPITYTTLSSKERVRGAIFFLVLGSALLAIIGIVQFFSQFIFGINETYSFWMQNVSPLFLGKSFSHAVATYPSWLVHIGTKDYLRATGVFPDPHMLSFYLGMTLPWAIALPFETRRRKFLYAMPAALILCCDLLTFSRGGYLGILACLPILLFIFIKRYRHLGKISLLLFSVVFLLFLTHNPFSSRIQSSLDMQDGSNVSRIAIWKEGVTVLLEKPFGVGLGNYSLEVKPSAEYREPIYAHMVYLDIALECGIAGLLFFFLFLLSTAVQYYKKAALEPRYLSGMFSIVIYSAHSLVENALFSVHIFILLLVISAIGARKFYEHDKN